MGKVILLIKSIYYIININIANCWRRRQRSIRLYFWISTLFQVYAIAYNLLDLIKKKNCNFVDKIRLFVKYIGDINICICYTLIY